MREKGVKAVFKSLALSVGNTTVMEKASQKVENREQAGSNPGSKSRVQCDDASPTRRAASPLAQPRFGCVHCSASVECPAPHYPPSPDSSQIRYGPAPTAGGRGAQAPGDGQCLAPECLLRAPNC